MNWTLTVVTALVFLGGYVFGCIRSDQAAQAKIEAARLADAGFTRMADAERTRQMEDVRRSYNDLLDKAYREHQRRMAIASQQYTTILGALMPHQKQVAERKPDPTQPMPSLMYNANTRNETH